MDRIASLRRMLAAKPGDAQLHYFLATELLNAKQPAEAAEHLEAYLAAHPDDQGAAYRMLGHCLRALGKPAEAKAAWVTGVAQAVKHGHQGMADDIRDLLDE